MKDLVPLTFMAKRLGHTPATLQKWSRRAKFPRLYLMGRRWFVNEAEVENWLDKLPGDPERDALFEDSWVMCATNGEGRPRRGRGPLPHGRTAGSAGGLRVP